MCFPPNNEPPAPSPPFPMSSALCLMVAPSQSFSLRISSSTKTPWQSQVRYWWWERATQSPFGDDVTGTSPLAAGSRACKGGHKQPSKVPCAPGEAAVETCGRATMKTPAASLGSHRDEPREGSTPQLRIRLQLLHRAEDLGDLSWGRASINLDYWGISLSISCLLGEKSGRAAGHGGCTKTQQPSH